jgi:hypothetical protein
VNIRITRNIFVDGKDKKIINLVKKIYRNDYSHADEVMNFITSFENYDKLFLTQNTYSNGRTFIAIKLKKIKNNSKKFQVLFISQYYYKHLSLNIYLRMAQIINIRYKILNTKANS